MAPLLAQSAGPEAQLRFERNVSVQIADTVLANDAAFIAAWDRLAADSNEPNPFCESWYLLPALKQFDPLHKTALFVLWAGDPKENNMVGILPLSEEKRYSRWPIHNTQNWLHSNAFLGSPIVRPGYENCFWEALFSYLDGAESKSIFFHLNGLAIGGSLQVAMERVCAKQSRRLALVYRTDRAYLQGEQTPQSYFENAVRSKKRKELRRLKNRLAEIGTLSFARSDGSADLEIWTEEFLALEHRGWKGQSGSSLASSEKTTALFYAALIGAAQRGRLELLDLRLDGAPIAMLVTFLSPPGSFSFKTAFDEEYAHYSPGVLLQIENLDLLARDGIDYCDSCAAAGHPMIDSIWTGRRAIGRYSVAIGGPTRRRIFATLLKAELMRQAKI